MIKITTDSTCDLPGELLERYGIRVIPLGIVKGEDLFRDGVDITTADIAAHVSAGGEITTTNAVNIIDYEEVFVEERKTHEALIHINIGMGFSSCYQNACLAAEDIPEVYVVDSGNLSTGHGMLVLAAAEAAEAGKSAAEIVALLEDMRGKVEISFALDTLEYMKKGGRCSTVAALGANVLKLHPCIEVQEGKMSVVKKYRGSMEKVVTDYVRERLESREGLDTGRIVIVDTCADSHLAEIARQVIEEDGRFREVIATKAGCTIFCHCGPDTLGLVLLRT